jgi:hypothetical protein
VLSQQLQPQESLKDNYQPVLHTRCQAVLHCCPTGCWRLQLQLPLLLAAPAGYLRTLTHCQPALAAAAAAVAAVGYLLCCLAGDLLLLLLQV